MSSEWSSVSTSDSENLVDDISDNWYASDDDIVDNDADDDDDDVTRVEQHIHFWLGEEASTDEAAIAAYKVLGYSS